MVGSVLDLIANIIFFVTEPLSLIKLIWHLCMRIVCFLTLPWFGLFKFICGLYLNVCWRLIVWGVGAISIPIRVVTALQREKVLEARLYELQTQLEGLIFVNKDTEERLELAVRHHKRTEILLAEAEEEQDRAIEKIHLLETKITDLEAENRRLREVEERAPLGTEVANNGGESNIKEHNCNESRKYLSLWEGEDCYGSESGDEAWNSLFEKRGKILSDYVMGKGQSLRCPGKSADVVNPLFENKMKSSGHLPFSSHSLSKKQETTDEMIYEWRGPAMVQSLFSACLSLLVGMIAWEAGDPCMPLVIALFMVVGMSLKSVVQFFSKIENRPGSDAVALLSFNWFILGTLASPALPNLARLLIPFVFDFGCRMASWFGFVEDNT